MEGTRRYSFQPPKHAGRAAHAVHFLSALYKSAQPRVYREAHAQAEVKNHHDYEKSQDVDDSPQNFAFNGHYHASETGLNDRTAKQTSRAEW